MPIFGNSNQNSIQLEEFGIIDKYLSFSKEKNIDIKCYMSRTTLLAIGALIYAYLLGYSASHIFHFDRAILNIVIYITLVPVCYSYFILVIKRGIDGGYSLKYLFFVILGFVIFILNLLLASDIPSLLYVFGLFFGLLLLRIIYHKSILGGDEASLTVGEKRSTFFLTGVSILNLLIIYGLGGFFGLILVIAGSTGGNSSLGIPLTFYIAFHIICLTLLFYKISSIIKLRKNVAASPLVPNEKEQTL